MAESEVESILREIRERVLSQQQLAGDDVAASAAGYNTAANQDNGTAALGHAGDGAQQRDSEDIPSENLALINSYLTTTARSWDRLPPLVSNRSGTAARLELWLKGKMKRATRWYAWEQVNFNAAVHHAIRDMLPVLAAYEQELEKLRARIDGEKELRQVEFAKHQAEITSRLTEVSAEFRAELPKLRAELRAEIARLHVELEALRAEVRAQRETAQAQRETAQAQRETAQAQQTATEAQGAELSSRLVELVSELRERDERLQAEQRVTFKQLSLEASEAAVLEDRARRKTEALLEELKRRVEKLGNTHSDE